MWLKNKLRKNTSHTEIPVFGPTTISVTFTPDPEFYKAMDEAHNGRQSIIDDVQEMLDES